MSGKTLSSVSSNLVSREEFPLSSNLVSSLLIKPVGANCNQDCCYCFYAKKSKGLMSDETLQQLHFQLLSIPNAVTLNWQGGEPTLRGLAFYEKAVLLQQKLPNYTYNTIQTNGLLLDTAWIRFLKREHFAVGLSLDGSEDLHNCYRSNWALTVASLKRLQDAGIETQVLCTVNDETVRSSVSSKIRAAFAKLNIMKVQFILIAEEPYAPAPEALGKFMIATHDLAIQGRGTMKNCTTQSVCGDYLVVDHDGSVYSCDFYCDEDHRLGDIFHDDLQRMLTKNCGFGWKKAMMHNNCYICPWLRQCYGGCPRERDRNGLNRFCKGFKAYFEWVTDTYKSGGSGKATGEIS